MAWITTGNGGTTASTGTIWIKWCETGTASSCSYHDSSTVWGDWCTASPSATTYVYVYPQQKPRQCTAAEIKAEEERLERVRKEQEKQRQEEKAAEKRANELLLSLLDTEQRKQLEETRRFYVVSESGQRYEIDCKLRMHNVFEVDENGKRLVEHCIYQQGNLPLPDNAAAQLLMLQTDEKQFKKVANQRRLTAV